MLALVLASTVLQPTKAAGGVEVEPEETQVTLEEITVDRMGVVQQALEMYKQVRGQYPSTEEWYLSVHPLKGFVPRTYLFDSSKRPLRYMGELQDGSVVNYRLETHDGRYVCPFNKEQHRFFGSSPLTILVPTDGTRLRKTQPGDDARAEVQLRAIHTQMGVSVAWYLDGEKIETTQDSHEVITRISSGGHHLLVVDDRGYSDHAFFSLME
jgi:membrane carboxypeptidase/penicillin-binding protein PbpC